MVSKEDLDIWEKEIKGLRKLKKKSFSKKDNSKLKVQELLQKARLHSLEDDVFIDVLENEKLKEYKDFKLFKNKSLGVDRKTDKKLKKGDYPIDLKLDLHGLTLDEAYCILRDTIDSSYKKGHRLILVVTGKGLHSSKGEETIKSSIQNWLSQPEEASKIIKYVDAAKKHGGKGALYVLLRRN